jgi:hypothetical protein
MGNKAPPLLVARDSALVITIAGVVPGGRLEAGQIQTLLARVAEVVREVVPDLVVGAAPVVIGEIILPAPPGEERPH